MQFSLKTENPILGFFLKPKILFLVLRKTKIPFSAPSKTGFHLSTWFLILLNLIFNTFNITDFDF